jgi:hypothetical protein
VLDRAISLASVWAEATWIATNTVIDAPIESCAALEICVMSKALRKAHFESGGLDRILKKRNDHSAIFQVVYDLNAPGVSPREFCSSQLWTKEGDGTIILTYESVDLPDEFPMTALMFGRQ